MTIRRGTINTASVTDVATLREYYLDYISLEQLQERLMGPGTAPTRAQQIGTALHHALENLAVFAQSSIALADFRLRGVCDEKVYEFIPAEGLDLELDPSGLREVPFQTEYECGWTVRGRADLVRGLVVTDYKSTARPFDLERMLDNLQWKLYLDGLGGDEFVWDVFTVKDFGVINGVSRIGITKFERFNALRYPELHADCERAVAEFVDVVDALPTMDEVTP